jgi:DNA topoisomerase-1
MEDGGTTITASLPEGVAPADLTPEQVEQLVRAKATGPDVLGVDPATAKPVLMLQGRFGPYVQLGEAEEGSSEKPRRASLPRGMEPSQLTLELALRLLSLPRNLGNHPESGKEITAGVGRFGPFVVHDGDFRSLQPTDDVYSVDLARAVELLSAPKAGRTRTTVEPIRTLGPHPRDGEPVQVFAGRYGPYVKHGGTNASLPNGVEAEAVTMDQAVTLLAEREAASPAKKGARGKKSAPAKKAPPKKAASKTASAVKKSAAKKTTAKKTATRPAAKRRP